MFLEKYRIIRTQPVIADEKNICVYKKKLSIQYKNKNRW